MRNGIRMPYNPKELYTYLEFKEKQMHIMIEVEEFMYEFLEDEFWDEEAIQQRNKARGNMEKFKFKQSDID